MQRNSSRKSVPTAAAAAAPQDDGGSAAGKAAAGGSAPRYRGMVAQTASQRKAGTAAKQSGAQVAPS